MKEIARRDYYQQKKRMRIEIKRSMADPNSRTSHDEPLRRKMKGAGEANGLTDRAYQRVGRSRHIPWRLGRWLFKVAKAQSLKISSYFMLDIQIEESGDSGIILMRGDQILTDEMWHDSREKKRLIWLILMAESMWFYAFEQDGEALLQIGLSYRIKRLANKSAG